MNYTFVYPLNLSLVCFHSVVQGFLLNISKLRRMPSTIILKHPFPSCPSPHSQWPQYSRQIRQTKPESFLNGHRGLLCLAGRVWESNHWTGPSVERVTMPSSWRRNLGEETGTPTTSPLTTAQVYLCTHLAPCCAKKPRFLSSSWWLQKLILRKESSVSFMPFKDQHSTSG